MKKEQKRALSLDAFRGYSILTMVLSSGIVFGVLPAWMYHAQEGPRSNFLFDESFYGITWVDLVFPFFLFAMGAAFPFSIGSKLEKGMSRRQVLKDILLRFFRLIVFAVVCQHLYPFFISSPQNVHSWLMALVGFGLLFPMFMRFPAQWPKRIQLSVRTIAYAVMLWMLLTATYANGKPFSLYDSNIILLVLANMALFGSLIYMATINHRLCRIAILPILMGLMLGSKSEASWNHIVFEFTPVGWAYKMVYLKYLFIVIPGMFAGDFLKDWLQSYQSNDKEATDDRNIYVVGLAIVPVLLMILNLYGLYTRSLLFNLSGTIILLALLWRLLPHVGGENHKLWSRLFWAGAYLLLLGLVFEAYEGGVRKSSSTYSYYFITSGLAFLLFITFTIVCDIYHCKWITLPLGYAGQNPMIAYVSTQLLVMPVLNLTGLAAFMKYFEQNAWLGFLQGVILTAAALLVTAFFTKRGCFWRT